ncbi:hypothetical protein JCM8097_003853 [Rhodosporidiobolus ruineniae]
MTALPAPADLLSAIRSSCAACTTASQISIDEHHIDAFIRSVDRDAWEARTGEEGGAAAHGVRLPLRFDSAEEELNLLATLALLNFLSGYRTALHRLTGRGAYSSILSLVLSAYLSSAGEVSSTPSLLTAAGMRAANIAQLAELMRMKTHTEKPHPELGSAVMVGEKDDEAFEILGLLEGVLRQTGEVLQREGKASLGEWVVAKLKQTDGDVGKMVAELASTFPAFDDVHTVDGKPVYLFKKALWLLSVVALRFSSPDEPAPRFPLPKIDKGAGLPVFADNVLPSLLLHLDILCLASCPDPALAALAAPSAPSSAYSLSSSSATKLRAAAVTASSLIVARAHALAAESGKDEDRWLAGWTERKLDAWLWDAAKEGEKRSLEGDGSVRRIAERGTVFY